ncbi:MAG: site-specific DNA-methyltransferase [Prevotella sp.]|uniref:DNA methyltransferase n=1 Tax=Prevotella sp. TaxID=59823 RepID=UPI0025E07D58|nr:DNA methyltransferase [Prevotella sp.]MCI7118897.1 site-specific DNA-methyltransferase [Prevotella sp.]
MKFDHEHWHELDINVDSLWIMGPRAKGGKHTNVYHGNFAPQIPNQMIRRYTEEGDIVMELFMGSGTTLFECETLKRNYIGFDINSDIINFVEQRMEGCDTIDYRIHNCDVTNSELFKLHVNDDLRQMKKQKIDLLIVHPPYLDIVKFTDKPEDLSGITDINIFLEKFITAMGNALCYLKAKHYFALVIGDIYRNGEVIPLGFYLMYAIKKAFNCQLKGIVVKDIVGNRAKIGQEALWKYRALVNGNYLFKHEYLFVFKTK